MTLATVALVLLLLATALPARAKYRITDIEED
jgi:hypothetical protein